MERYLIHPLLGNPKRHLPREPHRAFLAAQVEVEQFCDKFKSLHLIMEDLKAAREEILGIVQAPAYRPRTKRTERFEVESKTTVSSVFGTFILRLLYTTGDADEVLESKIGPTLLGENIESWAPYTI
jgi:hypothetical protein